jgi:hypothetical protein
MARPQTLARPVSIQDVVDGGCYRLPIDALTTSNLFFDIARVDGVFVKAPSSTGLADFKTFVADGRSTSDDVRPLEPSERLEALNVTSARYPAFGSIVARHPDLVHILVVLKQQHERMRENRAVGVPDTRFGLLAGRTMFSSPRAAVFQEQIAGTTLWEMFDFENEVVRSEWESALPAIAAQLAPLVDSPLALHVDWNIQNFVYRENDQQLFYVDVKPTTLVNRRSNEHNLRGIRDYFVQ